MNQIGREPNGNADAAGSADKETIRRQGARRLRLQKKVLAAHPTADRGNVWHTFVLLEQEPIERPRRRLRRGRGDRTRADRLKKDES
jgi:hypothetical protein